MSRMLRLLLAASLLLSVLPLSVLVPPRTAHALDAGGVTEVVTALQSLGTVVNSLSDYAGLGQPIPFTTVDPSEALNLDTLFTDALGDLGSPGSLEALAAVIEAKDNPNLGGTGIAVTFDNVVGNDGDDTLTFNFTATRVMNLPLTFSEGDVNLDGSDIAVAFSLTAPFAFGYDGGASNPSEKVFLTNVPTIAVMASANVPAITAFESLLGFIGVSVGGNLALNVAINSTFADPDNNGRLNMDEWASTALGDLVTVAFADATGNDIDGNLTLDASIVPGTPDATVVWLDADLADGPGTPTVTLNALDDFTNINATDIFSGLATATTALLSAQQSGDLQLPFIKESLSDVFSFADPLVQFVHELGDAAVVCGPNNTVPPSGPIFGLASGETVYCQAYTVNPVDQVVWKIDGTAIAPPAPLTTIGPGPSTTVQLVLGTGGLDSVTVEFHFPGEIVPESDPPEPKIRLSRPLFLTADQLTAKLASIAGIDTTPTYDATKKTLTYHLVETLPDVSKVVDTDFADQLKAQTGLFGLNPSGSDKITVDVSNINLDVTFGAILVADPTQIKAGGTQADRFFLQVGAGNEFQADVAIAAGSNFGLEGRLAFLKVTAGGVDSAGNPGGAIFALNDSNDAPGAPAVAVNITAPGITGPWLGAGSIPDAILVSDLLDGNIGPKITAECELGLSAGLEAKATNVMTSGSTTLASGKVAISWPDVFQDGTCIPDFDGAYDGPGGDTGIAITPDGQFNTDLFSFDINPQNPLEMLSIILNSINGLASGIDALPGGGGQAGLDAQIPVIGVSPREMLDKLEEIKTVMNKAAADPAGTLDDLEQWLQGPNGLDIPADALKFELGDVGPAPEKDLILRLGYSKEDDITRPLNFDLNDGGLGLVSATTEGDITLHYTAGAQFDVAIPLKLGSALADTLVLGTTKATVGGTLEKAGLNFKAAVGPIEVGVTGLAKADVHVEVKNPDISPLAFKPWADGVRVGLTGSTSCGDVDVNPDPNVTENKTLSGQACALLGLEVGAPIGMLGFRTEDITSDPVDFATYTEGTGKDWFAYIPPDLTTNIANNLLNWGYLFQVLPELTDKLEGMLKKGSEDVSVPGLGEALDAGANVVGALKGSVIDKLSAIGTAVTGTNAGDVESQIRIEVKKIPILQPYTGNDAIDNVAVVTYCGFPNKCAPNDSVSLIDDVRVTFKVGQAIDAHPDFLIGIDGLPIEASGAMQAGGSWSLLIDVGLNKTEGPYIVTDAPDPELDLTAYVGLDNNPNGCKADPGQGKFFPQTAGDTPTIFPDFSATRCLEGKLAFLAVGLHDGNNPADNEPNDDKGNDPTNITLTTTLDLKSTGSNHLTAGNIINSVGLDPRFQATANIDLALRTSIELSQPFDGLPGVVGAFHLDWSFDTDNANLGVPTVKFDNLYIDAGTFVTDLLGPVVTQVRKVTSPLEPIVDFIQAEVPILTQLAEMVGQEPVTVLWLIQKSAGFTPDQIALINSVLQFIQLANRLPDQAGEGNLFIPLGLDGPGYFSLLGDKLLQGGTTPDQATSLINTADPDYHPGSDMINQIPGAGGGGAMAAATDDRPTTFGVKGLSFPFLNNATEIFGLLLGKDVTIVHMDFGTFKASVSKGYEFGPIFIGPFPVTAEVGLSFTAEARFAMGYDTRGLREMRGDADITKLFRGLYIDDYDSQGLDVDEWRLTFRVYAEAALDVVIVEAGIYGGVDAILSGNLHDPKPDGKLYFDEVWEVLSNPICLFDISGKLDLFLGIYLEVDLFFWSDRWELEIVRLTLLDFTWSCKGKNPNLAYVDADGNIVLNMGDDAHRNARGIQPDEHNEEFTVRQVGDGKFSVEAFGLKEDVPDAAEIADGKAVDMVNGKVLANADDGNDIIALVAGAVTVVENGESTTTHYAFTLGSSLTGGSGNDSFTGGDGDDTFYGGDNDDKLIGGIGEDELYGEGGADRIDGGLGADTLDGGGDNDQVNGGPGGDTINGGDGNDSLLGGPWSPGVPEKQPYLEGRDGVDTITGGIGNDIIDGGPDNDILWGDEADLDCEASGANDGGNDNIQGGPGNDTIVGGWGDDTLVGNGGHVAELWPYPDNDRLCGNSGADTLDGDDDDPAYDLADYNDGTFAGGLWGGPGNDIMYGRGGADQLYGGADDDYMEGNGGADTMNGDAGQDDMIGGSAVSGAGDEGDVMHGGDEQDVMAGDNASITRPGGAEADGTIVRTVTLRDPASEGDTTEAGMDEMYGDGGNDDMYGGAENDTMYGNAGLDVMRGGKGIDTMQGNADNDEMYGDSGKDRMFGNENDDTMRGGLGDDTMEGNAGTDTMYGDAGQDDMIGGSNEAGQPDAGDFMFGNADQDVMVGDNATIARPNGDEDKEIDGTIVREVTLHDLASGNGDTSAAGNDDMQGDEGNDDMYGSGENDTINGNAGDDMLEGNGGGDTMWGDAGQDDLIGGTSQGAGGQPDAGDKIYGGSNGPDLPGDFDVIAGDNASIVRLEAGEQWVRHTYRLPDVDDVVLRRVTLYDVATTGDSPPTGASAGDEIFGEAGFDILYGQGADDLVRGGSGDDFAFGNAGDDRIYGDSGQDDLIGGTGRTVSDDPGTAADGRLDGADVIYGGDGALPLSASVGSEAGVQRVTNGFRLFLTLVVNGATSQTAAPDAVSDGDFDAILGDNGTIERDLDGAGLWVVNSFNDAHKRIIRLYDVGMVGSPAGAGTAGSDSLYGEADDDLMYGQGGSDRMYGGAGEDTMEGNADGDEMLGNGDNDDMVGGTGLINDDPATGTNGRLDANDFMYGNDGFDVMAGDNALLARTLVNGQWVNNTFNAGIQHQARILLDENSPVALLVSGGDLMRGGAQDDLMYGQAGNDDMDGNEGDDFMEGNSDDDVMKGSEDQDDMIGGSVHGTIWDGADTMDGGLSGDVMAGDNASIERPVDGGGLWQIEPNTLDEVRTITLLNVEVAGGPAADPLLSGSDTMYGDEGSDRMFGQGNDDVDDDGDGLFSEDPTDGVDNDRDGREGVGSGSYDCLDKTDNDNDGFVDGADADCAGKIDEDGGGDVMFGNEGHDFMEGNHGADLMFGNAGEDDMWGGSSADATGVVGSGTPPDNLVDTNDIMRGGEDDDVLIGDNGTIVRETDAGGIWLRHQGARANGGSPYDMVVRNVGVTQSPESAGAFGDDWMQGNAGEDELYGQQGHDYMEGNDGEDAMVGDLGRITSQVENGSRQRTITVNGPFFEDTIYVAGTFTRLVELYSFLEGGGAEGNDTMLGGADRDSVHGGPGNDMMNGNSSDDNVFGGDGDDVIWGGPGDDDLWGGYQDDYLDVRPRVASALAPADPPEWFTYGAPDNYQDLDLIYGGWDRDALQANVAAPGPRITDRLIDWAGGYNVFYVCPGAYGEGTITRMGNPSLLAFLQDLSAADGALDTRTDGSSGFRELAYVFTNQRGQNSHPPHPDHPGHFTCDDGSIYVPPKSQTLRVVALDLMAKGWPGRSIVNGQVTVQDDLGSNFMGATVSLIWTLPNGASVEQTAITDKKGIAGFAISGPSGTYQALVSELALGNTALDAAGTVWLKAITTK